MCCLWSTSRNELWVKGATSGDTLDLDDVRINCEQNSLLFLVTPRRKGACHTKDSNGESRISCYYRRVTQAADGSLTLEHLCNSPSKTVSMTAAIALAATAALAASVVTAAGLQGRRR